MTPMTKKDQILQLARKDPFLRVEEIAGTANTTTRYVRTILSEAKLSLMDLRRDYARRMERRLGIDITMEAADESLVNALSLAGNEVDAGGVQMFQLIDPEICKILKVDPSNPLLKMSRVRFVNGRPFFLNEVITHKNVSVNEDVVASEKPLRQLLGLEMADKTIFIDRSIEVVSASEMVAASLNIRPGAPTLKSGNVIETEGERVGIEFNYFDAFAVRFVLTGASEYRLKVEEKMNGWS